MSQLQKQCDDFISKSRAKYGDKFDYSKCRYVDSQTKVVITCPTHGEFQQTPSKHLRATYGCRKCAITKQHEKQKLPVDIFIYKSRALHGDKFDYSKCQYIDYQTKVVIICPHHGEFQQTPNSHLNGNGCRQCAIEYTSNKQRRNKEDFVEKANKIHNHKYDYSTVEYTNNVTKVTIVCPNHGIFEQRPACHLKGRGCAKCGKDKIGAERTKTTQDFIEQAMKIHVNSDGFALYQYSQTNYKGAKIDVIITCSIHGDFKQNPCNHVRGFGCPHCSRKKRYSSISLEWLKYEMVKSQRDIEHALNGNEHKIANSRYLADGYDKKSHTIYEFHGDYFHGNPKMYSPSTINPTTGRSMGELYTRTLEKKEHIINNGYNYIEVWESDWLQFKKAIIKIQRIWRQTNSNQKTI